MTWFALGLFAGAAGKSAQFPLHVWLPDAMEGPTPVSADSRGDDGGGEGVYLVARFFPVFAESDEAMTTVAVIGSIATIIAALLGIVATDIKRVMAYSTISQLGYMMMGLGVFGLVAAIFHLFTHAFFKALLFLGSGSVNHATGTFDMRKMGGLASYMPITFGTMLIGSLSLVGLFPLAGFWSKDEILSDAWEDKPWVFAVAMTGVFLTALYVGRMLILTFSGEYKGGEMAESSDDHSGDAHPPDGGQGAGGPSRRAARIATVNDIPTDHPRSHGRRCRIPQPSRDDWLGHTIEGWLPEHTEEFVTHRLLALDRGVIDSTGSRGAWSRLADLPGARARRGEDPGLPAAAAEILDNRYYLDALYEDVFVKTILLGGTAKGARAVGQVCH